MNKLSGKIAIVTGAGKGIGREAALAIAAEGATVVAVARTQTDLDETVKMIEDNGGSAISLSRDLTDGEQVQSMVDTVIEKYGKIDILVNNAGVTRDGLIMKMSEEDFDRVLDTNLKGAFHTIRHASRYFLKQKSGKIINISSVSGVMGNAGQANYSASKAGVIGLTKSVARELASRGITCNAVAPGFIETEMTEAMPEASREAVKKQIPLQRTGQVSDVAGVAAFLASDLADYITGQVISVDGGMHM